MSLFDPLTPPLFCCLLSAASLLVADPATLAVVRIITSADGLRWQRTRPRLLVIAHGACGSFDGGSIPGVSSTCVHVRDETWACHTAMTTSHGAPLPAMRDSIGRAEWRRHGFVSLDAGESGRVESKPPRLQSPALVLNANAKRGEIPVALLEDEGSSIPGYTLAESEPRIHDATRWPLRWRGHPEAPTDRPVRVVLAMKQSHLYSLSSAGK